MQSRSLFKPPAWFDWLEEKAGSILSFEKLVFILLVILQLLPVWTEKYILNTDGPAHVYSSKVLLDYFFGRNLPLYRQYFELRYFADPNWFSRFWLMFLQVFVSGRIAEKLLVSAYFILFPVFFRKLIVRINPGNSVLSFFVFPVLSHHVFNYGFYNYSFAIAFVFGFLWYWQTYKNKLDLKNCLIGFFLCSLLYFTHLWGFIFAGAFTSVLILSEFISLIPAHGLRSATREAGIKLFKLFCMMLPGIIMTIVFIKTFLLHEELDPGDAQKLIQGFFKLDVLLIYSQKEALPSQFFAFTVLVIFVLSLLRKLCERRLHVNDGFLVCTIAITILYFLNPDQLTVGAFWIYRLVLLPYLFMIVWSASVQHFKTVKVILAGLALFLSVCFTVIRWPYYHRVSESMAEYFSLSDKIPMHSTVLPLSFNHKGNMPDGSDVCPEFWKFIHVCDYLCADRNSISLGHNNWIPLLWQERRNPFHRMGDVEGQPPGLNFNGYPELSKGGSVDYVITWCFEKNYTWTWQWQYTKDQLQHNYALVDSSPHGMAKLYKLKSN